MDQNQAQTNNQNNVTTLVQMLHITGKDAQTLLKTYNNNLQMAIDSYLNPNIYFPANANGIQNAGQNDMFSSRDRNQELYQNSKKIKNLIGYGSRRKNIVQQNFAEFKKTYIIKKKEKRSNKKLDRKVRSKKIIQDTPEKHQTIEEEFDFNNSFANLLKEQPRISFLKQISQTFEQMWKTRKIIAVHCIPLILLKQKQNLSEQAIKQLNEMVQLYKFPAFAEALNKQFINLGLDPLQFDFTNYPFMRQLIRQDDNYTIVMLRYNSNSKIVQSFKRLKMTDLISIKQPQIITNMLQRIVKDYNRLVNNYKHGVEQITEVEKKRIEQDRKIRQQQEQDYFEHHKTMHQEMIKKQQEQKVQVQKQAINQSIKQRRVYIRQNLTKYIEADIIEPIRIKFRLPNSQILVVVLPKTQMIDYLFNYIQSHELDLMGFDNQQLRSFQLINPTNRMQLSSKRNQTLLEVFQNSDMQTIAVKQI